MILTVYMWQKTELKNTQLIEAFKTLSEAEFKEFGKFVASPFFNGRNEVVRFYAVLKKFYPKFNSKNFMREKVFAVVYPQKKYSDVLMRKLISLIQNLLIKYFTEIHFRDNVLEYSLEKIQALNLRMLLSLYEKEFIKFNGFLSESKHDIEIYEYQYKLIHELRNIHKSAGEKLLLNTYHKPQEALLAYFFSVYLNEHIQTTMVTNKRNLSANVFMNSIMNYIDKNDYSSYPLVRMYYLLQSLVGNRNEKSFFALSDFRNKYSHKLVRAHNYNIIIILMDYCIGKFMRGEAEYRKIMFGLSKSLVDENLFVGQLIDPPTFTNIVRNASIIGENDWAMDFIGKFKDKIIFALRSDLVNYCIGLVEFSKKNYRTSLKYFSKANVKWVYMKYDLKRAVLKSYYELGYYEELILQIDSFRHYMKNDSQSSVLSLKTERLFIDLMSDLNNIRIKENYKSVEFLRSKISKSIYFSSKDWFIEKIEELIK